jgi:hypothetical protein
MSKYLTLLERRPGINHDDFVRCIETDYLHQLKVCLPYVRASRRNYLQPRGSVTAPHIADVPRPPSYHVIIESWVDDSSLSRLRQDLGDPPVYRRLAGAGVDAVNHENSASILVSERETDADKLGHGQGPLVQGSMIKQVANLNARAGMTYSDFVNYYETQHATMAARLIPTFAKYTRNFVVPDSALQTDLNFGRPIVADFDVMTQIWFRDAAAYAAFGNALANPEVARAFAEDEAKLFDRKSIQLFMVDERID